MSSSPCLQNPSTPVEYRLLARSSGLHTRLALLVLLVTCEMIAASIWLDTADLKGTSFLVHAVADWGPRVVRILAAFAIFSLVFWNTDREAFGRIYQASDARFSLSFGLAHLALAFVFWRISSVLFGARPSDSLVWTWVICGVLTVACAALTFLSASLWIKIVRSLRDMLIFGAGAALGAALVDSVSGFLWRPASSATFSAVRTILRLFLTNPISDAATLTIGGPKFSVFISPQCSGIEGIGLMLAFGCAWLWFFRREYRFPRALLLIPVGIGAIWLANAVRIAVLVLIGEAGAERIALGGFHSQAGWIAFLAVALAFSAGSRRLRWLCVAGPAPDPTESSVPALNPAAPYLMPLLAILAAALVAQAASAGFEWLYPLRFFAAGTALWIYRREYCRMDWSVSWIAPAAGILVFAIWMGLERAHSPSDALSVGAGLAGLSSPLRNTWLFFRVVGAVITVPLAEELAFRGFLMRRLAARDIDSVSLTTFALAPFVISSVAFGTLHGERWLAGTLAGAVYAAVLLRRGSIGDAVLAHSVTNAVLAVYVLSTGAWSLW